MAMTAVGARDLRPVCPLGATLGEGPVWIDGAVWCVDIKDRRVHRFDPATSALRSWTMPAPVGWVLPYAPGGLLVGLRTGIHWFEPDVDRITLVARVEPALPGNRLNDACVDRRGRLWLGSMDDDEAAPTGHLYRADAAGIARLASGIVITNGPAISPDGATLYDHDTLTGTIHASRIGDDGALHDRRVIARVDAADGYPDGPAVDAEGCLWVGLFAGWGVRRYDPSGRLMETVRFPVANVTKICFGGPGLATAYATTATKGLSVADRAMQPLAGDLFAFDPGVGGLPCPAVGPFGAERQYR